MSEKRKDSKGRVLKDGEVYRKSDGLYMYRCCGKKRKNCGAIWQTASTTPPER